MKNFWLKSSIIVLFFLSISLVAIGQDEKTKRAPRPEPREEVIQAPPGRYYYWESGSWKWKKKQQEWVWREGYWHRGDYYRDFHSSIYSLRYSYLGFYGFSSPLYRARLRYLYRRGLVY